MKIVVGTNMFGDALTKQLSESHPGVRFVSAFKAEDQRREIADADGYLGRPDADALSAAQRLRWIHVPAMGIDTLQRAPGIAGSGIVVTNSPGPHTQPIADHVMFFVLALAHQARQLLDDQRAKRWETSSYRTRMVDLDGASMLLLGIGGIGRAVSQRAMSFGIQVSAIDPNPTDVPAGVREVGGLERLDAMLPTADWLVVTAPLTPETRNLIDARRIGLLKPGAFVVVISRGGIVDEGALADALRAERLAGAALDVANVEPLPPASSLWEIDSVLISPHCSGHSPGLWAELRRILEDQVGRFVKGRPLAFVCDVRRGY